MVNTAVNWLLVMVALATAETLTGYTPNCGMVQVGQTIVLRDGRIGKVTHQACQASARCAFSSDGTEWCSGWKESNQMTYIKCIHSATGPGMPECSCSCNY
ncbi:hypothetical protein BCR37DRAFT_377600 [Protomyces lactucae-debilis]|uniref:Uncharacterized protein n=1 Tax=Protomyces lactucae-debilis TaxID=2754530 RepID=A0A1Y2FLE8_PROLT|nr:uncharacterized protein BCR37DRAFT_377600 [Protomyces lactucae-debilis]ORY84822.1 hypothetical protein BCR37DRAFT_377600 [Protomyces lactucae-debilis]